ncbi:MAG TPA: serine/threonine-protein phosphatase [Dermatophilaceae bacterium]|nr:serine/threonine-protein phosphatase [Dermatophilaceae bacterium]
MNPASYLVIGITLALIILAIWRLWPRWAPRLFRALSRTHAFREWDSGRTREAKQTYTPSRQPDTLSAQSTPTGARGRDNAPSRKHLEAAHADHRLSTAATQSPSPSAGVPVPRPHAPEVAPDARPSHAPTALTFVADGRSEVGLRRENQDAWSASPRLAVLADGVGGMPEGKRAAHVAVQAVNNAVDLDAADGESDLRESTWIAHAAVKEESEYSKKYEGMSTTLDIVGLFGNTICGAHVGDGRVYLMRRDEGPELLTSDDSIPGSGSLSQALGRADGRLSPSTWSRQVTAGDRVVMLSDGAWAFNAPERGIEELLRKARTLPPAAAAHHLVQEALEAGSNDNATVVVIDLKTEES